MSYRPTGLGQRVDDTNVDRQQAASAPRVSQPVSASRWFTFGAGAILFAGLGAVLMKASMRPNGRRRRKRRR